MAAVRPPRPLSLSQGAGYRRFAGYRALQLLLAAAMALLLSVSAPSPFAEGIVLKGSGPDPKPYSSTVQTEHDDDDDDDETDGPSEAASRSENESESENEKKGEGEDWDDDEDDDKDEEEDEDGEDGGSGSGSNPLGTCATTSTFGGSTVSHSFCLQLARGLNVSWSSAATNTADVIVRATTAVPYGWVGFGLSPSCRMVGSSVVIGYVNADDTSQSAAAPFALTSYSASSAVSASSGSFLAGTPSLEVADGGGSYALRFSLNLPSSSSQCVVWARGPALSGAAFAKSPVPGFGMHSQQGSSRFDFATGTASSAIRPSPSPSPSPSPKLPPPSSKSASKSSSSTPSPKSPPKASPAKSPAKVSPAKSPPKASPVKSPPKASPAKSPPKSSPPSSPPPSPKSPPSSPPPAGGCTDTFGGATVPQTFCVNLGSNVTLSWTLSGKTASAIVRASTSEPYGWIGFGLSSSCAMLNSQVLIGYANGANPAQIAVRPFIAKSYVMGKALATPTKAFTVGSPTVEVPDGSTVAMRFGVQLTTTGRQCVTFAKGPALTAAQFAQTPVPGFQYHSAGSDVKRVNFATGVVG